MNACTHWVPLALALCCAVACGISDASRCSEGRLWRGDYSGCVDVADAGGTPSDAGAGSALGTPCSADTDCTSAADGAVKCLTDPTHPTNPGMCTIPNCTSGDCGSTYVCCDCSGSALASAFFTLPMCVPSAQAVTLTAYQCTCG